MGAQIQIGVDWCGFPNSRSVDFEVHIIDLDLRSIYVAFALLIFKGFSPSRMAYLTVLRKFCKSGPISRGFSASNKANFTILFLQFREMGPSFKYFADQNGMLVKGFLVKN